MIIFAKIIFGRFSPQKIFLQWKKQIIVFKEYLHMLCTTCTSPPTNVQHNQNETCSLFCSSGDRYDPEPRSRSYDTPKSYDSPRGTGNDDYTSKPYRDDASPSLEWVRILFCVLSVEAKFLCCQGVCTRVCLSCVDTVGTRLSEQLCAIMVLNFQQRNRRVHALDMMTISFYLSVQIIEDSDNRCSDNRVLTVVLWFSTQC